MPDVLPLRAVPPVDADSPLVADARGLERLGVAKLRTIRRWDSAGLLPKPIRIGGRVVWRVDEIHAWLNAGAPCRETWERSKPASFK